jgi:hypothetical protein
MKNKPTRDICISLRCFLSFVVVLFFTPQTFAFYTANGALGDLDLGATLRASSSVEKFVENSLYSEVSSVNSQSASLRGSLDYSPNNVISMQCHAVLFYKNRKQITPATSIGLADYYGVERSPIFFEQHDSDPVTISDVDRLNVAYVKNGIRATLGRQPINLATTFYFSPNDLFAPFAANTFYRIYKPGVDAFRLDKDVGELGQFNFIYALGYQVSQQPEALWSENLDSERDSLILRYSDVRGSFGWSLLGGQLRDDVYFGFGLQGELFEWLGVRAEGQLIRQNESEANALRSFTIGLEHHWQSSLDLRLEYFFNGFGKKQELFSVADLFASSDKAYSIYPGREYLALGQGYELSPLLYMQTLLMLNINNNAGILSFDLNYSLSDDVEINVGASTSFNSTKGNSVYNTEFSYYPDVLTIELRAYF